MRTASTLAAAVAVGVCGCLIAGCTPSRGLDIPRDPYATPDPLTTPSNTALVALLAPAKPGKLLTQTPAHALSMPWHLLDISADGTVVDVIYAQGNGGCVLPAGFAIAQTADAVVLEAVSTTDTRQQACADVFRSGRATITLPTPVGGSTGTALEHAKVDGAWDSPVYFADFD
jgi:hypothetical protein